MDDSEWGNTSNLRTVQSNRAAAERSRRFYLTLRKITVVVTPHTESLNVHAEGPLSRAHAGVRHGLTRIGREKVVLVVVVVGPLGRGWVVVGGSLPARILHPAHPACLYPLMERGINCLVALEREAWKNEYW